MPSNVMGVGWDKASRFVAGKFSKTNKRGKVYMITKSNELWKYSRLQMFFKIGVLKNLAIFTGKHLYQKEAPTQVFSCEH